MILFVQRFGYRIVGFTVCTVCIRYRIRRAYHSRYYA